MWRVKGEMNQIFLFIYTTEVSSYRKHIKQTTEASVILVGIYLLKVNKKNIRTRCEICSKLTIKIPERRHWRRSGVFSVSFEHILHLVLVFLLLTLNMKLPAGIELNIG